VTTGIALPDADQESLHQVLIAKGSGMKFSTKTIRSSRILPADDPSVKIFTEFEKLALTHPGAPVRPMIFVHAEKMYDGKVFVRGNPNTKGPDASRPNLFRKTKADASNLRRPSRAGKTRSARA
jgi:hypothetical protein